MNPRTLSLIVVAIVLTSAFGAAVAVGSQSMAGQIVIIHTNDTHGNIAGGVGIETVAGLRTHYEGLGATVFAFDAGDTFTGTAELAFHEENPIPYVLNSVGYDAMTLGNHDFDHGNDEIRRIAGELDFDILAANVVDSATGTPLFAECEIIEKDGFRLGVFGIVNDREFTSTISSSVIGDVSFTDTVAAAERCVESLEADGADLIVALGHVGVNRTYEITSDAVCSQVDGIDVFIDGHSHTVMEGGEVKDCSITLEESGSVIASTGAYTSNVGVVTIAGGRIDAGLCDRNIPDQTVGSVIDRVIEESASIAGRTAFTSTVFLDGIREHIRTGETNLGDLTADMIRSGTGADIAVCNAGGIRASAEKGDITMGDLYAIYSLPNNVTEKVLTGEQVLQMMEISLRALPSQSGAFLQVSGIEIVADAGLPTGDRVISITMGGVPLDMDRTYRVASVDYVLDGNEGYGFLTDLPRGQTYGPIFEFMLVAYTDMGVVSTEKDGRITIS